MPAGAGIPKYPTWESYFIDGTYDGEIGEGVLKNRLGISDYEELEARSKGEALAAAALIRTGVIEVARTYDAAHLRELHRELMGSVFEWAGEYREIGADRMQKNASHFAHISKIEQYLADAARIIEQTDWPGLDRDEAGERMAEVFAYVNQAHPFREGNGRTNKLFLEQVAELSRFRIHDFTVINPEAWNQRSELTSPNIGGYEPHPQHMVQVFRVLLQPADGPAHSYAEDRSNGLALRAARDAAQVASAAFPHPATGRRSTDSQRGPQAPSVAPRAVAQDQPGIEGGAEL